MTPSDHRRTIITVFAGWTVLSALRRAPIRNREVIYPLLNKVDFAAVFVPGPGVSPDSFADWHRAATGRLCEASPQLCVGWAAKMLNVYLKTAAYVGDLGRPGLKEVLHPPLDAGLWKGVRRWVNKHYKGNKTALLRRTHRAERIKDITDYKIYEMIIGGCRDVAKTAGCKLIEVDHLWEGAAANPSHT